MPQERIDRAWEIDVLLKEGDAIGRAFLGAGLDAEVPEDYQPGPLSKTLSACEEAVARGMDIETFVEG